MNFAKDFIFKIIRKSIGRHQCLPVHWPSLCMLQYIGLSDKIRVEAINTYLNDLADIHPIFARGGYIRFKYIDRYYKVGFSASINQSIELEYTNWLAMKQNLVWTSFFLENVEFHLENGLAVLSTPAMDNFQTVTECQNAISVLMKKAYTEARSGVPGFSSDMTTGLTYLYDTYKRQKKAIEKIAEKACNFSTHDTMLGFCHGDLHPGNVLKGIGYPVMIDTVRISNNAVLMFDVIHASIAALKGSKDWISALSDHLSGQSIMPFSEGPYAEHWQNSYAEDEMLLAYFLDRVGKEYSESLFVNPRWEKLICSFLTQYGK